MRCGYLTGVGAVRINLCFLMLELWLLMWRTGAGLHVIVFVGTLSLLGTLCDSVDTGPSSEDSSLAHPKFARLSRGGPGGVLVLALRKERRGSASEAHMDP